MKILHVINNIATAGAEKLLADILPKMRQRGNEVHLLISNGKKNSQKFENILLNGDVKIFNLGKSFYDPRQIWEIVKLINKEKYDIIHSHLFPTQYWVSLASYFTRHKGRYIKTEHSVYNERRNYKLLKPLERLIYGRFDAIIGITDEVTQNLVNWLESKRLIVTIPNGVNLEEIRTAIQNIEPSEYKFLDPDNYKILMVGRFDGIHKDQMTLIKAINNLDDRYHLYFAGEGPHEAYLKKVVANLHIQHRVHFLGLRRDVYALMHLVDLNVLSSKQEGLSGVALESMASFRPFIGSNVPGIKNIVPSPNHLFPQGDHDALKNKIEKICTSRDIQSKLVFEATTHIQSYDISKMINSYIDLYENILD